MQTPYIIETQNYPQADGSLIRIELGYDECAETPRFWDNLGTILIHPNKAHWVAGDDEIIDMDIPKGDSPYTHAQRLVKYQLGLDPKDVIIYPITKHEHGNVSLSLGSQTGWDSGIIGFVYVSRDKLRGWYPFKRLSKKRLDKLEAVFQEELDLLSAWINGESYAYCISKVTYHKGEEQRETLASCRGFLDDLAYCRQELLAEIEALKDEYVFDMDLLDVA